MHDESYFYEYEENDEYCYPKTNVLKNTFNIHDEKELRNIERSIEPIRATRRQSSRCAARG